MAFSSLVCRRAAAALAHARADKLPVALGYAGPKKPIPTCFPGSYRFFSTRVSKGDTSGGATPGDHTPGHHPENGNQQSADTDSPRVDLTPGDDFSDEHTSMDIKPSGTSNPTTVDLPSMTTDVDPSAPSVGSVVRRASSCGHPCCIVLRGDSASSPALCDPPFSCNDPSVAPPCGNTLDVFRNAEFNLTRVLKQQAEEKQRQNRIKIEQDTIARRQQTTQIEQEAVSKFLEKKELDIARIGSPVSIIVVLNDATLKILQPYMSRKEFEMMEVHVAQNTGSESRSSSESESSSKSGRSNESESSSKSGRSNESESSSESGKSSESESSSKSGRSNDSGKSSESGRSNDSGKSSESGNSHSGRFFRLDWSAYTIGAAVFLVSIGAALFIDHNDGDDIPLDRTLLETIVHTSFERVLENPRIIVKRSKDKIRAMRGTSNTQVHFYTYLDGVKVTIACMELRGSEVLSIEQACKIVTEGASSFAARYDRKTKIELFCEFDGVERVVASTFVNRSDLDSLKLLFKPHM